MNFHVIGETPKPQIIDEFLVSFQNPRRHVVGSVVFLVSSRRNMYEISTISRSGEHEGKAVEVLVHELGGQEVPDICC
jgi:hypothetical protein